MFSPTRGSVVLVALLLLPLSACRDEKCKEGQMKCGQSCIDVRSDPANCGTCLHACPPEASCSGGACVCPGALTACGDACVDLDTDDAHCGSCLESCGLGSCAAGACTCDVGATACTGPGAQCVDVATDTSNCGECRKSCLARQTCDAGVCNCPTSERICGEGPAAACTDTQTDEANCGTCGHACTIRNEVCTGGSCACPQSLPDVCNNACVNEQTDALNCGSCGYDCPLVNQECRTGVCGCPAALPHECSGACVDRLSDEANCGTCGTRCASGATCTSGDCQCPAGQSVCGTSPGTCVNLTADPENCMGCGNRCPAGAMCVGFCMCMMPGPIACGGTCCAGTTCCGSACQPAHSNGLGGSYYLGCALFAPSATTHDAALAAADSWRSGTTYDGTTTWGPNCIGRQTTSPPQCAVWCYAGSNAPGMVGLNSMSQDCNAVNPYYGVSWN